MVSMDDIEDDARYPPNQYGVSHQRCYGSLSRRKLPVRNLPYSRSMGNQDVNDDEVEDEEDFRREAKNREQNNVAWYIGKNIDNEDDDELDDGEEEDDDDGSDKPKGYNENSNDVDLERHPKKRKLKNLLSSYEFAPRVPAPAAAASSMPKPSHGGRNSLTDWTEHETFVLLDAWGDCFLQLEGASGKVYAYRKASGKQVAVKLLDLTNTAVGVSFQNEITAFNIVKKLSARYFVKIHSIERSSMSQGIVVMKMYDSDLLDYIQHYAGSGIPERQFKKMFKKICKGVQKLHDAGIAHLDLKPENILLKKNKPYICDFGSCYVQGNSNTTGIFAGTLQYAPPEVSSSSVIQDNPFNADFYALGVLLHVGLTGFFPFTDVTRRVDLTMARQSVSANALDLMRGLLSRNPSERLTSSQILSHSWFSSPS